MRRLFFSFAFFALMFEGLPRLAGGLSFFADSFRRKKCLFFFASSPPPLFPSLFLVAQTVFSHGAVYSRNDADFPPTDTSPSPLLCPHSFTLLISVTFLQPLLPVLFLHKASGEKTPPSHNFFPSPSDYPSFEQRQIPHLR